MIQELYGPGLTGAVVVLGLMTVEIVKVIRDKRNGGPRGFTSADRLMLHDSTKAHERTADAIEKMSDVIIRMDERSKVE